MCGIAGLYAPGTTTIDRALLERMTEKLAPRGPDSQGTLLRDGVAFQSGSGASLSSIGRVWSASVTVGLRWC